MHGVRAGELDQRITIQAAGTTRDAAGGVTPGWTDVVEVWAGVARTPGNELFASASRQARVPTVFRIRYRDGLSPAMRVVWRERVFEVRSVVDQGPRSAETQLVCEELVGEAAT